ncbi:10288_t:CDS:2, partial [Ambispora leptoticha]
EIQSLNQNNSIEEIDKEIAHLQALKKQNTKVHLKQHNLSNSSCGTSNSPSRNTM